MNTKQIMIFGIKDQMINLKSYTKKNIKDLSTLIDKLEYGENDDLFDAVFIARTIQNSLIETNKRLHSIQLHMGKMYEYFGGEE